MTTTIDEKTGEIITTDETTGDEPDVDGGADDEQPDTQTDDEDEQETVTPPPVAEDLSAAVFDKAIKRAKTYMSAVPDILGDSAQDLSLCPRCTDFLPGFILPTAIKPVPLEQKVAVKLSIGELGEPEYKQADDAFTCGKCDGEGKVSTGSKLPSQATARCLECQGRGWVGPRAAKVAALPPEEQVTLHTVEGDVVDAKPVADPWGRTIDDPLYGVMPGFERA